MKTPTDRPPSPVPLDSALVQSAFEQSRVGMLLLDPRACILIVNRSARGYLGIAEDQEVAGHPIWEFVGTASRNSDAAWRGLTEGAAAGRVEFRDIGSDEVIEWTAQPIQSSDGVVVGIAMEGRDVTALRRTDGEARLLTKLALAIGHTDSLELAISAALRIVCESAGWLVGEAWLLDTSTPGEPHLTHGGAWTVRDPRLDAFASQSIGFRFARGEGLAGVAWERREPVSAQQFSQSTEFTRSPLAAAAGIKSAIAIPVLAGDEIVAVLNFFMASASINAGMAKVTTAAAAQLGPLILQKQAEEAHRVAEARLRGIVSIALDAIISIDDDRRVTLFNWGAERIFGYSADEMIGQPLDVLLPEALRARHAAHIAGFATSASAARRMGERSPIVGRRKNGEIFPAEASISRFRAGGHWTFSVILRDITDRQRTEEGLRFLAETGALLTDLLRDPTVLDRIARRAVPTLGDVCVIDLVDDTRVTTAAVAAVDERLAEIVRSHQDVHALRWDGNHPVVAAVRRYETQLMPDRAHDDLGLGSMLVVPLITRGQVLGAMSFAMAQSGRRHDTSYQALAEQLAVRVALAVDGVGLLARTRRAVAARDEVLAVVSHDLRNPLSAINMCVGVLRGQPAPDAAVAKELLETVHESTALMSRIIQDLLDIASIDAGRLSIDRRPQSLRPVLVHAVQMLQPIAIERQLTLTLDEVDSALPNVAMDADRVLQVLANLLHNASKFTEPGGAVRMAAERVGDQVQVSVQDTGRGIARDDLPRVFDRFWHDRQASTIRSTGLGLAIARGIVEAHGGRIWVESATDRGSTFTFTLPLIDSGHDQH